LSERKRRVELVLLDDAGLLLATDTLIAELDEMVMVELAELLDLLSLPPQALSTKPIAMNGSIF
jgi:hypothetical protein